jgi:hypothetical protein
LLRTVLYAYTHQLLDTMYISIHLRIQQDNDMCNQLPTIEKYTSWKQYFSTYKIREELKFQFNVKLSNSNAKSFSCFLYTFIENRTKFNYCDTICHTQKLNTRDNTIHNKKTLHQRICLIVVQMLNPPQLFNGVSFVVKNKFFLTL